MYIVRNALLSILSYVAKIIALKIQSFCLQVLVSTIMLRTAVLKPDFHLKLVLETNDHSTLLHEYFTMNSIN